MHLPNWLRWSSRQSLALLGLAASRKRPMPLSPSLADRTVFGYFALSPFETSLRSSSGQTGSGRYDSLFGFIQRTLLLKAFCSASRQGPYVFICNCLTNRAIMIFSIEIKNWYQELAGDVHETKMQSVT